MLAEMLVAAGRAGAALDEVERAIAESEERAWPIWLPELHRRRGEVLLALSAPRADEAEACFGEALNLARNQGSNALALRAATQPRPPVAAPRADRTRSRELLSEGLSSASPRGSTRPTCARPGASSTPSAACGCPCSPAQGNGTA